MTIPDLGRAAGQFGPSTIWLSGLSASGKSTLAQALAAALAERGIDDFVVLDGETIREKLVHNYGHSLDDRADLLRDIVDLVAAETAAGRHVIVATISHQSWMRDYARQHLQPFFEVRLDCPPDVCAARDIKGHWARAINGDEDCFIGVTHDYETGQTPDLVLDTAKLNAIEATTLLVSASLAFLAPLVLQQGQE